jgi:hypothetical protein
MIMSKYIMRVGVLVYGRLNKCVEHYNNIMETLGVENDIDFFLSSDNPPEALLNDFLNLYKPKSYINDSIHYDYDLSVYPGNIYGSNIHNMTCHFINKNRVFGIFEEYMKKENITYDAIVSLRIDCIFNSKFIFNNLLDDTIYIPYGYDYIRNAINDQIAYGKVDVMKKYNSINPVDLLKRGFFIVHPESLNAANIYFHNLKIERVPLKYHR